MSYDTSKTSTQDMRALRVDVPANLQNIRVILMEPQEPGNIGSTARAMKGMGLSHLFLVKPVPWRQSEEPWRMACSATDILQNARAVSTLEEALEGVHYLVGTTHRRRSSNLPEPMTARDAAQHIASISQTQTVGLLFGREDYGLTNEQLSICHLHASIPMAARNPSLNLSHAVMVFAYEIFMASLTDIPDIDLTFADVTEVERLYQHIANLLTQVGFVPYNNRWNTMLHSIRRVFGRVGLEQRDIDTLHCIFSEIDGYITRKRKSEGGNRKAEEGRCV